MIINPNAAVIDLGWLGTSRDIESWLRLLLSNLAFFGDKRINPLQRRGRIRKLFDSNFEQRLRCDLYLLERLFEFDELWIDQRAFESRNLRMPEKLSSCIKLITPSLNVYKNTAAELSKQIQLIPEDKSNLFRSLHYFAKDSYFDKIWGDTDLPACLASSRASNDWIRAIFYLGFSESLGVVPLLSGTKMRFLSTISRECIKSQHDIISKIFDSAFFEEIQKYYPEPEFLWTLYTHQTPPIIEHVLEKSVSTNTDAIDLLLDLRESSEAMQYRTLLSELRLLSYGSRGDRINATKIIKALRKVADTWAESLDSTVHINYVPRKIKLKKLPLVGSLFEIANLDEISLKDKLLSSPPGYLVFCSSWYASQFSFGASDGYVD